MARSDWRRPASFLPPGEGRRRIRLFLSYDGSRYHGWQCQGEGTVSVQSRLEQLLSKILEEDITIYGSGRTDSGVHALRQCCHFDTSSKIEAEKFRIILNSQLEKSIRILSSDEVGGDFHARFSTESREYWYLVKDALSFLPFDSGRVMQVKKLPDPSVLNSYARHIFGTHDFTVFASARDPSVSKFRDIYLSEWDVISDTFGCPVLRYRVAGNAFMYHQVRSMVGTMLSFAEKGMGDEEFRLLIESKDRMQVHKTAPSDGLYLADVSYDRRRYQWFEDEYAGKQGSR